MKVGPIELVDCVVCIKARNQVWHTVDGRCSILLIWTEKHITMLHHTHPPTHTLHNTSSHLHKTTNYIQSTHEIMSSSYVLSKKFTWILQVLIPLMIQGWRGCAETNILTHWANFCHNILLQECWVVCLIFNTCILFDLLISWPGIFPENSLAHSSQTYKTYKNIYCSSDLTANYRLWPKHFIICQSVNI